METKSNEVIEKTSDLDLMLGKYLAEKLVRSWTEDFVDEDTAEVIAIERKEILMQKGTFLASKEVSEINFFLQSGDIKEVSISNQQRSCFLVYGNYSVWVAKIKLNNKNKSIYLYANSVETARQISIDYIEQKYEGNFRFLGIRELEYSTLIPLDLKEEDINEDNDYYKIEASIAYENEEPINQTFIISAPDAEVGKRAIINYIQENNVELTFETTLVSAKTISCSNIIDVEFSKNYMKSEE